MNSVTKKINGMLNEKVINIAAGLKTYKKIESDIAAIGDKVDDLHKDIKEGIKLSILGPNDTKRINKAYNDFLEVCGSIIETFDSKLS